MSFARIAATGICAAVIFNQLFEDRAVRYGSSRFMLDAIRTNEIFVKDNRRIPVGVLFASINAYKKDLGEVGENRLGVAFSKMSGTQTARYIRGTNIKLRDIGNDVSQEIVFTTNGPHDNVGEICSRKFIEGYFTTMTCRVLDERDLPWVKRAAIQAGHGADFPIAYMPYKPPVVSKISEAIRQQTRRNAQHEALRNK